jgi:hypothetical protein
MVRRRKMARARVARRETLAHVAELEGLITAEALADTAQRTTPPQFIEDTLRTLRSAAARQPGAAPGP